jgi:Uma2 family endonuclease
MELGWEEFLTLPEDGNRYEILDGDLVVTPPPAIRHQRVLGNLNECIRAHVRANDLGLVLFAPTAVRLHPNTIVEPDLLFVAKDRTHLLSELSVDGPPNLVVEILSPSTAKRDRTVKAHLYAKLGIDHYWIVDTRARSLEAFERDGEVYRSAAALAGDATFEPTLLPGLRIPLAALWS